MAGESEGERFERELVIENDIAWRIHTLVDFMFPDAPRIVTKAGNQTTAQQIEAILAAVISASGGTALWQDAALLGAVYGHVDFILTCEGLSAVGYRPSALRDRTLAESRQPTAKSHVSPRGRPV